MTKAILICLALAAAAVAQERKTVYVDRMEGLEPYVEKALQAADLPFDFIEEERRPELKAGLRRLRSAHAELIYKHKFGRNETHRLELRDVQTNRVIARHDFDLRLAGDSRRQAAEEFAAKVKRAWSKRER